MVSALAAVGSRSRWVTVAWCVMGCASVPSHPSAGAQPPPDLHGEVLALLPPRPIAWLRVDVSALRRSPHYDRLRELRHEDLDTLNREVGFDVLAQSQMAAIALYAPPGDATTGWPVLVVRREGAFDQAQIMSVARARSTNGQSPEARVEGAMHYQLLGTRAYVFPAPDVMVVMERGMVRRVAARLAGREHDSALNDPRFDALWERAGATMGTLTAAADLASLRAHSAQPVTAREASLLELAVGHAEGPGEVTVSLAAQTVNAEAARTVVSTIDAARREAAGQMAVRLLGLAHLLESGIEARADGRFVDLRAHATQQEATRAMRAASLAETLGASE